MGDHDRCPLCGRTGCRLTQHHRVPVHKGGGREHKVALCRDCHSKVHSLFTNAELARNYDTFEKLREVAEIRKFIKFIRKVDPSQRVGSRESRERKRKREDSRRRSGK